MKDALAKLILVALEKNDFVNLVDKKCVSGGKYLFKFNKKKFTCVLSKRFLS